MAGRVGPVDPAGQHGHRRAVDRPARRGGRPRRSRTPPRTPPSTPARDEVVAELARDVGAVGGGRPGADHGHRASGRLGEVERAAHPQARAVRRPAGRAGRTGRARRAARATRWSPGQTNRMPWAAASASSRSGSRPRSRCGHVGVDAGDVALVAEQLVPPRPRRPRATSRRTRRSPGSVSRLRATRASRSARRWSRSSGVLPHQLARSSSGPAGAQPQRGVELATARDCVASAQVGDGPRQPVHPGRAASGQRAGVELGVEQPLSRAR